MKQEYQCLGICGDLNIYIEYRLVQSTPASTAPRLWVDHRLNPSMQVKRYFYFLSWTRQVEGLQLEKLLHDWGLQSFQKSILLCRSVYWTPNISIVLKLIFAPTQE